MAETRKGEVTFKGNPITLVGPKLKPGDKAPDFKAVGAGLAMVSLARHGRQGPALQRGPLARHTRLQQADQAVRRRAQGSGRQGGRLHRQHRSAVCPGPVLHRGQHRKHQEPVRRPQPQLRRTLRRVDQRPAGSPPGASRLRGRFCRTRSAMPRSFPRSPRNPTTSRP